MEEQLRSVDVLSPDLGARSVLTIFRRRIWVMIPVAIVIMVLAVLYALVQPRVYEASIWMLVSSRGKKSSAEMLVSDADVWESMQGDVSMHMRLIKGVDMAREVKKQLDLGVPVYALLQHVNVSKLPGASADLLSLSYRSQDPKQAQTIVNAWAKAYEQDSRERSVRSTVSAIEYVTTQIETVEADLRQMEEEMADIEREYLEVGVSVSGSSGATRLRGLLGQFSQNRVEMEAAQAQIDRTRERLDEEPREIEEVETQPSHRAQAIEQQLSQLHVTMQDMLQDYYPDSPEVQALQEQMDRLDRQLEDSPEMTRSAVKTTPNPVYMNAQDTLIQLLGNLDALRARQSALQKQLSEQKELEAMAPEGSIAYSELMRKVNGLQEVHSMLLSRLYELQLKSAMVAPPVQLVREAEEPTRPVAPQYPVLLGMGLVAAVLLAIFAAVIVDQIDDTFASPDEMTAFANATRMLASTVRIEMSREGLSSLVVTSSGRAEGKTLVAANLATALAGTGEKVLLVDADLHRPRIHTMFDVDRNPGLSHLLVGEGAVEDVIQPTEIENLSVITAGPSPPSPVDLLASPRGQEIIEILKDAADYVIWDTPPAGFLADATVIAHLTDKTLFVVGKQAKRGATRETLGNLRELGVSLLGLCANRVRPVGGSYYYYYYYYHEYYKDAEDDAR
jgi:capsular exopolysaccharide synthesis family protein